MTLSDFQRISIPMPTRIPSGAVSAKNIRLKYGGPTEILPPNASIAIGYRVPSRIAAVTTARKILFSSSAPSRDNSSVLAALFNSGARQA